MTEVSLLAYCKMILHTLKYPHKAVNGVLLAEPRTSKDGPVRLVEAIPLFHINLHLTPMLEVAFQQVDHYCRTNDMVIAGYYQANELQKDSSPNLVACRIAEKIAEYYPDCCLMMVDGQKLQPDCEEVPLRLFQISGDKWKEDKSGVQLEAECLEVASNLQYARAYTELVDFDNHLDHVTLDWTNVVLGCKIYQFA